MRHILTRLGLSIHALAVAALLLSVPQALAAPPPGESLHDRIVRQYLNGTWDDASAELLSSAKQALALPPAEKADVDYIRKTIAECRPAWWKTTKAGQKVRFRPVVWGHTLSGTYDPAAKTNIQINFTNGVPAVTLTWNAKEMDDPAEAEHGFTKGELNDLTVWSTLGTAQSWMDIPLRSQTHLDAAGNMLLTRYLGIRGGMASAYYGTPRARRWSLWLGCWAYNAEHAKDPTIMCRKAMGAMYIAEVVGHPKTYPSVKVPKEIPASDTEEKLTPFYKDGLGRTPFTLAEDMALREAIKAFASANENKPRATGTVILPNGLAVALDPAQDKPLSAKRDAWIKAALAGGK
ncbi:MAG TPA: hypothetical protein VFE47_30880 [Tepidisphaeraceae bacterium]|jgi:hypothetical protein|nr:hypothetical protein [Tepidisphaeraceae bacterium]